VERGVTTMKVYDSDGTPLEFNSQRVGPTSYLGLREASYGPKEMGFEAPTFGQLAPLVYSALARKDIEEAKQVIGTLRNNWMTGKTMALTGREGIFVDDNPDLALVRGNLGVYESDLRERLGERKEGDVVYSDDGLVRFVPHGFQFKEQSFLDFAENPGLIALVGNPERAIMLARASENYRRSPWLGGGFAKTDSPQLRVPDVSDDGFVGGRLCVVGYNPYYDGRYSFGVRKGAEGTRAEKQQ